MNAAVSWVGVALAGGVGAVLRLVVDAVIGRWGGGLPLGTFAVNLSGAFVLGLLDGLVLPPHAALVVGTGLVGAYTTFSTWMFETQRLAEERRLPAATANVVGSLVAGAAAAVLGLWLGGGL